MQTDAPASRRLRIGRVSQCDRCYLITTCTIDRTPFFSAFWPARRLSAELAASDGDGLTFTLAYIAMPDHLHWLFRLEKGGLVDAVRRVKGRSARAVNAQLCRSGPLWQHGFHDRAIRDPASLRSAARYVVGNAVRAGLVRRMSDYPHWDAAFHMGADGVTWTGGPL